MAGVRRYVIGITGASGSIYGVRLLQELGRIPDLELHLVVSKWGEYTLSHETGLTPSDLQPYVHRLHPSHDMAAAVSSGSFLTEGMVIVPCSMKTLGAIAHGLSYNLVSRAADVTLKEQRKLILVPRESPLSTIHLENMLSLARIGVQMVPPMPSFYHRPNNIEDIVGHTVGRIIDSLGFEHIMSSRWK